MYRMVYQGWSKAQALAEMQQGFGGEARMEDATRYIQQVDVAAIRYAISQWPLQHAKVAFLPDIPMVA